MPRPSRNVDQLLLQAGQALLTETGVRRLSIRQVTEHAGVNLGMFHYHFKTKDVFVRALLQQIYNEMFSALTLESSRAPSAVDNLRAAVSVLAHFGRDNRQLLVRLLNDGFAGEAVAIEFLRANLPRHLTVLAGLVTQAQREGALKKLAIPQAMAFLMASVGAPILIATAASGGGFLATAMHAQIEKDILTDKAIAERIDMALAGMAAVPKKGARK